MSKKLIIILLALMVVPVYAVEDFKVSDYGAGVQIWFEVENFDERNPDDDSRFALSDEPGAFGRSINSLDVGGDGSGFVRYTFDISTAGGSGGTWYFWGRVKNPSNQSDFMLVDGHPGDQTPVTSLPVSGLVNGQRVFEENAGDAGTWAWSGDNHNEGHTKTLQDGENTMWILNRQSGAIWDVMMWTNDPGYTPTDDDYVNALPGKPTGKALRPDPKDGAMISATWVSTTWKPGAYAVSHDIYLGESFDEVNDATVDSPVYQGNQGADNFVAGFVGFAYPDGLVPGTTYYWRVDEVNDADPNSPWKGDVWSFWIPPTNAFDPSPSDGGRYVDLEPTLTWQPGLDAKVHSVVFGDNFDEVSNAPAGSPLAGATFTPGALEGDKTYYWRVDEMNPPITVKGEVWSFTTIPDIPIVDPNLVAWYKFEIGEGDRIIDFSGHGNHGDIVGNVPWVPAQFNLGLEFLGDNMGHVEMPAGLVTTASGSIVMWVQTDLTGNEGMFWYGTETGGDGFGGQNEIHIHNQDAGTLGFAIEGSPDVRLDGPMLAGAGWNHVAATWDTVDGCRLYFNGAEVDFQTHTANIADLSTIRLGRPVGTGNGNRYHDGLMDDVRLFDHAVTADQVNEIMTKGEDPRRAGAPSPRNGALVAINLATPLTWSTGEGASQHDVYFGTDRAAVADADASDTTGLYVGRQNATSYMPDGITMGSGPFYWRIDEVANDGTIVTGGVWSFSVADYALVDDFESYNDIPAGEPGSNLVYIAWVDGFDNPNVNGSTMGYVTGASMETGNVHGGNKSVPLAYNNTTAGVSEVVRTLTPAQDWTAHGIITLSLWFAGDAANVPGQLYVKINGVRKDYDGDVGNLALAGWQPWNIDLTTVNTNLSNVTSLAIGIQGPGATGTLFLDDIRLYAQVRELITPVQPEPAGLVLHYAFEGNTNDSAGTNHGTAFGNPTFALGKIGQAMNLDGLDDYVAIDNFNYSSGGHAEISVCAWIRTAIEDDQVIASFDRNEYWRLEINGNGGGPGQVGWDVMTDTGQVDYGSTARVDDGQWHHVAGVFDNGTLTVYLDGNPEESDSGGPTFGTGTNRFGYIGLGSESDAFDGDKGPTNYFTGSVDDVRIYDRVLTRGEIAGLAGRVNPFDKPF